MPMHAKENVSNHMSGLSGATGKNICLELHCFAASQRAAQTFMQDLQTGTQ